MINIKQPKVKYQRDACVYNSSDYIIFKKNGQRVGTHLAPLHILQIAAEASCMEYGKLIPEEDWARIFDKVALQLLTKVKEYKNAKNKKS